LDSWRRIHIRLLRLSRGSVHIRNLRRAFFLHDLPNSLK